MNKLIWASNHMPTQKQLDELMLLGEVVYLKDINLLLYNIICNLKVDSDLDALAWGLLLACNDNTIVQPAGSLAFQFVLGKLVMKFKDVMTVNILYSYSKPNSKECTRADGSIETISTFKHIKFI